MDRVTDVDLKLLRVFVAVAEAQGFAAAESQLDLSTSTISLHMSKLEGRLGVRLCERGRSGFELTERGRVVYQESKRILKSLDDFSETLARVRTKLAGRLSIGMTDALVMHPLFPISDAIREFNSVENEVEIELVVSPRQVLEHDVFEGRIHAAIGPFVRATAGLRFTPLFRDPQDLYCGGGHPLFGAPPEQAAAADLSQYRSVVRQYQNEFDRSRLGVVRSAAVVNNMEAMLVLLLSGGYIGYLPRYYAQSWVERGLLAKIDREDGTYDSEHAILTKRGDRDSSVVQRFLWIVKDVVSRRKDAP